MKKLLIILTLGFLVTFTGTSEAYGHYCRWRRPCPPPRRVIVVHPYVQRIWIAPHWGWRFGRRVWLRGFWIIR